MPLGSQMVDAYLGLGSNVHRERNLALGVAALRSAFGDIKLSTVYENPAVGFKGDAFFNFAARISTDMQVRDLLAKLHKIEEQCGRDRASAKYSDRTLDIDLLLYGDMVCAASDLSLPRPDLQKYAFVLCPMAEIAGEILHPVAKKTIAELWHDFASPCDLTAVRLNLDP